MTSPTIWHENYKVRSYLINPEKKLDLFSMLNLLQDAGWEHAAQLPPNAELMSQHNLGWVLIRQHVAMDAWPAWGETITIRTWLRVPTGTCLHRDFEICVGGKKVGEATSTFVAMNLTSRKLVKMDWARYVGYCREDFHLVDEPPKLTMAKDMEVVAVFQVRNSDLDGNRHVNNTRYAQWVLDAMPMGELESVTWREYQVNFLVETNIGDRIAIQRAKVDDPLWRHFQGRRESDDKVVFMAQLRLALGQGNP